MLLNILILLFVNCVISEDIVFDPVVIPDQCANICNSTSNYNLPTLSRNEQVICQRGCRFFNILRFQDPFNINSTNEKCHLSCEESYVDCNYDICKSGCDLMTEKRSKELIDFIIFAKMRAYGILPVDSDVELLESETITFLNPDEKSQFDLKFDSDYKIPKTLIKTMPIIQSEEEITTDTVTYKKPYHYSRDWLDCASRNSGIPRWILLSTILSAVLIALWLSFTYERKLKQRQVVFDIDISDEHLMLNNDTYAELDIEKNSKCINENYNEFRPVAPPKYNIQCENI